MKKLLTGLAAMLMSVAVAFGAQNQEQEQPIDNSDKLAVMFVSDDPMVGERVAFMYTVNAKRQGWFDDVVFIIWGPSAKLVGENIKMQEQVKELIKAGVRVEACKACSDAYETSDELVEIGVDVKYMGKPLTQYLKSDYKVLTF